MLHTKNSANGRKCPAALSTASPGIACGQRAALASVRLDLAGAGQTLTKALVLLLLGLAAALPVASQENQQDTEPLERQSAYAERDQSPGLAAENLDMVAATPDEIREVLARNPGLMMELKRLMAKEATDRGQIVAEQDLEDAAILDKLDSDIHFRAMATRLLQRYGYLTPQINPNSLEGQEQLLMMRARVERMAHGEAAPAAPSSRSAQTASAHKPVNSACSPDNLTFAGGFQPVPSNSENSYEWAQDQASLCRSVGGGGDYPASGAPFPEQLVPETLPPTLPLGPVGPDLGNSPFLTASMTSSMRSSMMEGDESSLGPGRSRAMSGSLLSPGLTGMTGIPSESSFGGATLGQPSVFPYVAGGIPVSPPDYTQGQASHSVTLQREGNAAPAQPPVELVNTPTPYAVLPSLHDLYVQAAPAAGHLERFGLEAFHRIPLSNGLPMDLPAGPDYVLGPGDGLTIDLWGGVSQRLYRTVDREGRLALPEAGPLLVSGKSLGEVQEVVQRILRTQYRDVSADVSLTRLRTVRVYIVGEVASPGAYDISALSTPLNALWAAGGVTDRGSLRLLRHTRGNQVIEDVDVYDLLLRGIRGNLKNFENGDTLVVPPVGPQVSVDGMVRRPAIYELHGETNLAQVLDLAGGILPAAALRHIEIQRLDAHEKRTMSSLNIDETGDPQAVRRQLASFAVRDGDDIHIFPIAPYNSATVYLQGHVLRPGRYAFRPGMSVTDVVTSYRDLLPEPSQHYAEIIRLQPPDWRPVVENFDLGEALAHPQTAPKLQPLDTVRIFGRYDVEAPPVVWLYGEVRAPGEYRTTGQMHLRDAIYEAGGLKPDASLGSAQLFRTQPDGTLKILNVHLAAALDGDPMDNVLVEPRDRILVHRSLNRLDPPSVYIKGEVADPGRYPLAANMSIEDLLSAAGGPKRSADLKNGDLTRFHTVSGSIPTGEHERIDLETVAFDAKANIPLKDGDVLTVPQLPGWKDLGASVTLKGEVENPGVYGIRPGERLSSVIKRAGGLLPTAYPQGLVFTRVSVREFQEKSRQDLIQHLEQENPEVKSEVTASGAEEALLAGEAMQQRQRALEGLRSAPISGRLVVRMAPDMKGFENSSQDLELNNGDTIDIPKEPGFVLIIGQVYNTNAVTYVPGKNAAWYLGQGGGVTRLGDKSNIFIVRADGEVVSRHGDEWFSGGVLSSPIRPGDTIVVPEKPLNGGARWKNILAVAQLAEASAITATVLP